MNHKQREILVITQEEAAEVIQEISKVFRFGIDELHKDGMTHREKLQLEIGDLLCMIDLMIDHGLVDPVQIKVAQQSKILRLTKHSDIFQ